ncbi:MAG: TonB family protein [Desulfobacteraceae bacterium]|nr:MAG: TonB family protein [Desulfobacteraceae bacterium]
MKGSLQVSENFLEGMGIPSKTMVLTFGISFACHAILIGAMFFLPDCRSSSGNLFPSTISVSLVSLPAAPAGSSADSAPVAEAKIPEQAGKTVEQKAIKTEALIPEKIAKSAVKVEKKVSLKPEISKKKKVDNADLIKNAVKNMEKKVGESRPSTVSDAIVRMRARVENTSSANSAGIPGSGGKGSSPGTTGGTGSGTGGTFGVLDIYKAEIYYKIQQNWAYSEQLGGRGADTMAVLVIQIMPGGEIRDIRFEKKSGNRYLDDSAFRAIQKSNPLPPVPEQYDKPYYEVGLRFGTAGLK